MENREKVLKLEEGVLEEFIGLDLKGNPIALHKSTEHPGDTKFSGTRFPTFSLISKRPPPSAKMKGNLRFFGDVNELSSRLRSNLKPKVAHS